MIFGDITLEEIARNVDRKLNTVAEFDVTDSVIWRLQVVFFCVAVYNNA